jgi:hypothetical protein
MIMKGDDAVKILSASLSPYLWPRIAMLDLGDAGTSNLLELAR